MILFLSQITLVKRHVAPNSSRNTCVEDIREGSPPAPADQVSDNTAIGGTSNQGAASDSELMEVSPPSLDSLAHLREQDPAKNILLVLSEIRGIKEQMVEIKDIKEQLVKLGKMEATMASLAEQLGGAIKRTAKLESTVTGNSSKIRKLNEEVHSIKELINKKNQLQA